MNIPLFLTLTYNDENLKWGLNPTLVKRDITLFLKRLRKSLNGYKINYYLVGEYGTKFKRPHYHMILYGLSNKAISRFVVSAWNMGHVHIGTLSERSIQYVCKYHVLRGMNPEGTEKSFMVCSKGIGLDYVEKMKDYHTEYPTSRYYYQYFQYKMPLPRYYKEKIYNEETRDRIKDYFKAKCEEKIVKDQVLTSEDFRQ